MKESSDWNAIANLTQRAANVLQEYRHAVSKTNGKTLITEVAKQQHIATLRKESQRRLADIRSQGEAARANLMREASSKLRRGSQSDEAQLAAEMRKTRAWDRLAKALDAHESTGDGPDEIISAFTKDALTKQDMDALEVVREELPSYLRTNRLDGYSPQAMLEVNAAIRQTATPEQEQTRAEQEELQRGWKHVDLALIYAEDALKPSRDGYPPIPITDDVPTVDFDGGLFTYKGVPAITPEIDSSGNPNPTLTLPALSDRF
ncbi:MAG: hypothetical protein QM589_18805 [Thermomicrobiales bacterium]